jgi:hypothetical protein
VVLLVVAAPPDPDVVLLVVAAPPDPDVVLLVVATPPAPPPPSLVGMVEPTEDSSVLSDPEAQPTARESAQTRRSKS